MTLAATTQKAQDNTTHCEEPTSQHSQAFNLNIITACIPKCKSWLAFMYTHCYLGAPQNTSKCVKSKDTIRHNSHWLAGRQKPLEVGPRQGACKSLLVQSAWMGAQLSCTRSYAPPTGTTPSSAPSDLHTTLSTSAGSTSNRQKLHQNQAMKLSAQHQTARWVHSMSKRHAWHVRQTAEEETTQQAEVQQQTNLAMHQQISGVSADLPRTERRDLGDHC